jgi:signal transduction histidine kinase
MLAKSIHPEDAELLNRTFTIAMENRSVYELEHRIIRPDGSVRWLYDRAHPFFDEHGRLIRYVGASLDITERKLSEQALLESEARLKDLNENLENLVVQRTRQVRDLSKELTIAEQRERQRFSHILHESVQQTLFAAKTQIGLVDYTSPETMFESAGDIAEVKKLIDKAITTTKSLAIELNPPILKHEGLNAALKWLSRQMEARYGLTTCIDISKDLSVVKDIDQILIIQITRELLLNVVKHAKTKEVVVTGNKTGRNIEISVEDRGIGFDVDTFRKRIATSESGMGLFSIEERLHLFSGRLEIQSELNKGTRITVVMPVSEESKSSK